MTDAVCVISLTSDDDLLGRLGDARGLADRLGWQVVAVTCEPSDGERSVDRQAWIQHGAEEVHVLKVSVGVQDSLLSGFETLWRDGFPRLMLASADRTGRAWSARLAARRNFPLISPALEVRVKAGRLIATRLDASSRQARLEELPSDRPALVALRPGVAQACARDIQRQGSIREHSFSAAAASRVIAAKRLAADPATADVRHLPKLIAGGRGVGSRTGFDRLRRVAARLGAGVAASRVAVDLGWIEAERQVGQTGKTVRPELYIACGISGANHHWDGMSDSRHIVAINTDPEAPLLRKSHLALQGDLHEILRELDALLERST